MRIRIIISSLLLFLVCWAPYALDATYARSLFNQGEYAEAASLFEKILKAGTLSSTDMSILGLCYINLEEYDKAQAILERARKQDPFNSLTHIALGNLAFNRQSFGEAYDSFLQASRLNPDSLQAREGMTASLVNQGVFLYGEGKPVEAGKKFRQALEIDPDSAQAVRNLGILELKQGAEESAARLFQKAHRLEPDNAWHIILLISALKELDDEEGLLEAYVKLSRLQPYNPQVRAELGELLLKRGEFKEAEQAFIRAEELGTEEPYPYFYLAKLARDRDDISQALYMTRQTIGKSIQKVGLIQMQAAGRIEKKEGQLGEEDLRALKGLSDLILQPKDILKSSLRLLRELHGNVIKFEEDLRRLSSWYSSSVVLQVTLGDLLQEEERWEEALDLWQKLLGGHPTNAEAQVSMALSLEKLERFEEASVSYMRAIEIQPENTVIYDGLERVYKALVKEEDLLAFYHDRSYRDKRNPLLFRRLAVLEEKFGRKDEAAVHLERAEQLERERDEQEREAR